MTRSHPAALAAAATVADALADPSCVDIPSSPRGRPQSLAGGAVGIALLHLERLHSGHGDEKTAHAWLARAAGEPVSTGPNATLFHGAPALGYVLHTATGATHRYRRALAALDEQTTVLTRDRLAAAHARRERGDRLPMHEFDLVHGLTGLGVYHLHRHSEHPVTRDVLAYLVRLTEPLPGRDTHDIQLPPWWVAGGLNGEPDPEQYPHGHGNLGMAHGISAVIALLALALRHDVAVPGARDALAALCAWTDQWRHHTGTTAWWPGYVTLDHLRRPHDHRPLPPRPSWCYGTAGTARAQQLAGMALGDPDRQQHAEQAMHAALHELCDDAHPALLPDIGLCHGRAGLLQAGSRASADADDPTPFQPALDQLATGLATDLPAALSDPELMDGAAGAALALHTAGTGTAPATDWDAFLLLT